MEAAACSIEGCDRRRKYAATGWCQTHYHRYWRTGTTSLLPTPLRDDLTYFGAHGRVKTVFGSATRYECVYCGESADEWAYDGTDPSEIKGTVPSGYEVYWSVWPEFYMPLCFGCHRQRDRSSWSQRRTLCKNGHPLTPENTYSRPSRPNTRECRQCKAEESRRRYLKKKSAQYLRYPPAVSVIGERIAP